MPGSIKDQLPNRALSGPELGAISKFELAAMLDRDPTFSANIAYTAVACTIEVTYTLPPPHPKHELRSRFTRVEGKNLTGKLLRDFLLAEFDKMGARDYIFGMSGAYRKSTFTFRVVVHVADPYEPNEGRSSVITGEAPLVLEGAVRTSVIGLERTVKLENPNIDRINHDLPIIVQRATMPEPPPANNLPGEPPTQAIGAPGVQNLEFKYDRTQFPAPEAPVDADISQLAAAKLGVPVQTGV